MAEMDQDELLTSTEARAILKVSRQTLWRLEKSGNLTAVKIGPVKRFLASEVRGKRKPK
jgi:predicted DNA-binding transcriptional regulator AlpA